MIMPIKRELSVDAYEQLEDDDKELYEQAGDCLLYTSPSPRD